MLCYNSVCSMSSVHLVGSWAFSKKVRRVISSCTVKKIRTMFPSEDGVYTGYMVGDDDDSAHDSELEQAWRDFLNI